MTSSTALEQLTSCMILVLWLSMPPIVIATVIGVFVSLLQALTQVQEQTLSFAVKLIAVSATLAVMASMMGNQLFVFTENLFDNFSKLT